MTSLSERDTIDPVVLTIPGLGGSGPSHWQSLWEEARPDTHRVELGMWNTPHRNSWITKLDQAIRAARAPVVLAAHSLGCLAVAWWAELSPQPYGWPVAGALLVAPADVDRADAHPDLAAFAPSPRKLLPFPSIVVASSDDPWIELASARNLADAWGSHFVDAGAQGHLNAASGIGWWAEGQALLDRVIAVSGGRAPRSAGDARAVLAVSATDAAQAHYLKQ
ncbi:RBBP9/YdeN family alpha/beta hydrolase [Sphingomonas baiyangensis]|uniref:Alpha/beta hydrolase n=1 Tax=Sphingomonas baiyangensis TaxID=2572576 RepID=A0A4U1L4U0_9SPHN|nr:alpha/beta hydrolase [Sphingomonas baiyangensis]TKD51206.1 alpha/beta hydrolase [Sphingomonas baiyangensis]